MYCPSYVINTMQPTDPRYAILRNNMTLVIALKGIDGMVLASDSRTVHTDLTYHDNANKIFSINKYVAIALAGEIDYILPTVQKFQQDNKKDSVGATEIAEKLTQALVNQINDWSKYALNPVMKQIMEQQNPVFGVVIAGYDKVGEEFNKQRIYAYNFGLLAPQEVQESFYPEGYKNIAKQLLPSLCASPKDMTELVKIAKLVIKKTADTYIGVGGTINIIQIKQAL